MEIVSVSPLASPDKTKGHWHWLHKSLFDHFNSQSEHYATLGKHTEPSIGLRRMLKGRYTTTQFQYFPSPKNFLDAKKVADFLSKNVMEEGVIQIYEGGISELFLLANLSLTLSSHSKMHGIFNFHQASEWVALSQGKSFFHKRLVSNLKDIISVMSTKGWTFAAESSKLSFYLSKIFDINVVEYPIFTIFRSSTSKPSVMSSDRSIDVLFCPSSIEEFNFCVESWKILQSKHKGLTSSFVWRPARSRELNIGEKLVLQNLNIKLLDKTLSAEDYRSIHEDSKICVLPYRHSFYVWGSSGKINDALIHGCLPLVPKGTALEVTLRDYPYLSFEYDLPENLVEACVALLTKSTAPTLPSPVTIKDFDLWLRQTTLISTLDTTTSQFLRKRLVTSMFLSIIVWLQTPIRQKLLNQLARAAYALRLNPKVISVAKMIITAGKK